LSLSKTLISQSELCAFYSTTSTTKFHNSLISLLHGASTMASSFPPIAYPEEIDEMQVYMGQCEAFLEELDEKQSKFDPRSQAFVRGSLQLLRGDLLIEGGRTDQALSFLDNAEREISALIGSLEDQPQLGHEVSRRLPYIQGRRLEARARSVHEEKKDEEAVELLMDAAKHYVECRKLEEKAADYYHLFGSYRRLFWLEALSNDIRAGLLVDPAEKRTECYRAIVSYKKAGLFGKDVTKPVAQLKNLISEINVDRIVYDIEKLWEEGQRAIVEGRLKEAYQLLTMGAERYRRLQGAMKAAQNRLDLAIQERSMRSSAQECLAREAMKNDQPSVAAAEFRAAATLLQEIVSLAAKTGEHTLLEIVVPGVESNISYFSGMHAFSQGIVLIDAGKVSEAATSFSEGKERLGEALEGAKRLENAPLVASCTDALNRLETYLAMVGTQLPG